MDGLTSDVARVTVLQSTSVCEAGATDLGTDNNHPVLIAWVRHRELTA